MFMFFGKLLDVQEGSYKSLVFESKKFDKGLGIQVPASENIAVSKEDLHLLPSFKKYIGEKVALPVVCLKNKNGGIFYLSQGDIISTTADFVKA